MSTDPKSAAHYPPARAAGARLALIGAAFSAFALLGCFNFGYDDSGLPPPLTLTAMRPTFDAMLTAEAHATAQARGTAFAQSPIRPLGPPPPAPHGPGGHPLPKAPSALPARRSPSRMPASNCASWPSARMAECWRPSTP